LTNNINSNKNFVEDRISYHFHPWGGNGSGVEMGIGIKLASSW